MQIKLAPIGACAALLCFGAASQAATYYYTDWTSATTGASGIADGAITLPDSTVINVHYSGQLAGAQLSGGTNYWIPSAPYISSEVSNAPGTTDILRISTATSCTVTFDRPVVNPIMPIVSLGSGGSPVAYAFNAAFTILSQGTGYWGGGATSLTQSGNTLTGKEGHGTLLFAGTFTSISWTVDRAENWHGHTWGVKGVPEPATLAAVGLGLLGVMRRKRR